MITVDGYPYYDHYIRVGTQHSFYGSNELLNHIHSTAYRAYEISVYCLL